MWIIFTWNFDSYIFFCSRNNNFNWRKIRIVLDSRSDRVSYQLGADLVEMSWDENCVDLRVVRRFSHVELGDIDFWSFAVIFFALDFDPRCFKLGLKKKEMVENFTDFANLFCNICPLNSFSFVSIAVHAKNQN